MECAPKSKVHDPSQKPKDRLGFSSVYETFKKFGINLYTVIKIDIFSLGFVTAIQSRACAECSLKLGAGRQAFTDPINYAVGLEVCVDIGDEIKEGMY